MVRVHPRGCDERCEEVPRRGEPRTMSNTTTLSGNLTRDPEIRYTREGQASATFGLAVNRRWQSRGSDEWEEVTSFFEVVCWRDLAENVALSLIMAAESSSPAVSNSALGRATRVSAAAASR